MPGTRLDRIFSPLVRPIGTQDRSVLTLDGVVCGFVTSAGGGSISAPVVRESAGAFVRKRLGAPTPEPIELLLDLSLEKPVYDWISESWQGQASTKSGSLIALDADLQATTELHFERAVISATTIPAMDASAETACVLAIQLIPATINLEGAAGPVAGLVTKQRTPWLSSNFRIAIDGLDCTKVSKVNALTITSGESSLPNDRSRGPAGTVAAIDCPDVCVVFAEESSKSWADWHETFVIQGKNDDTQEKNGSLIFLAPDLQSQLGSVTFSGLGIYRLTREASSAGEPMHVRRTVAELYCQRMELVV